jgi:transposase InsO family protein
VARVNQVWSTDITYIRMAQGFVYLVAVMDWFSRYVINWSVSLTMELDFCVEVLKSALRRGQPNCGPERSLSAWMGEDAAWTTFLSSGCGGRSNMRRCI